MTCYCIDAGNWDFELTDHGCKKLLYTDLSVWVNKGSYETPDEFEIELQYPGTEEWVKKVIKRDTATPIHEGSCAPDGIYGIRITVCQGDVFTKHVAVMCRLKCRFECLLLKDPTRVDRLSDLQLFIAAAEAEARQNNATESNRYYMVAKSILDRYECDCNC